MAATAAALEPPATRQSEVNGRVLYEISQAGISIDSGQAPALAQFVITAGVQAGQTSLLGRVVPLPGYFLPGADEVPWTTLIGSSNPFSLGDGCAVGDGSLVVIPYIHNFAPYVVRIDNGQFSLLALSVLAGSYHAIDCASGPHGSYFSLMHANSGQVHLYRWVDGNVSRIVDADVTGVISGFGGGYARPSLVAAPPPGGAGSGVDRLSVLTLLTNGTTSVSVFDSDSRAGTAVWVQTCALYNRPPPIAFSRPNEALLTVSRRPDGNPWIMLAATPDPNDTEIRLFHWQDNCWMAPSLATGLHVGTGDYGWSGLSGIGWNDGLAQVRLSDRYALWPGGPQLPVVQPVPPAGDGPVSICGVTKKKRPRRTLGVRPVAGGLQIDFSYDRAPQVIFDGDFGDTSGTGGWAGAFDLCPSTFNF